MKQPLPRILSAVPQTLHVRLEIAKAIRTLAGQDEDDELRRRTEIAAIRRDCEALKSDIERAGEEWLTLLKTGLCAELKKYSSNQPRVPAGNRDGGQWTSDGGTAVSTESYVVLSDATPDNLWRPGAQYAANDPPGIGHNQGPSLDETPEAPVQRPLTTQQILTLARLAAQWFAFALEVAEPVGDVLLALQIAVLLADHLHSTFQRAGIAPGPFAGQSIPARGPGRDFTADERTEINRIGAETGCHTCGTRAPGTRNDNFVPDHQPPNAINPIGAWQRLFPQCLSCSQRQGGFVRNRGGQ
jgi:hypothetical protein